MTENIKKQIKPTLISLYRYSTSISSNLNFTCTCTQSYRAYQTVHAANPELNKATPSSFHFQLETLVNSTALCSNLVQSTKQQRRAKLKHTELK